MPTKAEEKSVESLMRLLLAAGFEPQFVLQCGYKAAHGHIPMEVATLHEMHQAAEVVLEAAKKLGIAAESQVAQSQPKPKETKDEKPKEEKA